MINDSSIKELNQRSYHENIRYSWEHAYNAVYHDTKVFNSKLIRLVLKNATFKSMSLKHCVVEDCYFRGAKFINVDFTGTKFKGCNFKNAQFSNCKFDYASFNECDLDERKIINNLGSKNIINKVIIGELRKNALSMGKTSTNDKLILLEKEYLRKYLARKLLNKNQRGNHKVSPKEKLRILFNLFKLYLGFSIWGYGIQIFRLIITAVLAMTVFAVIYNVYYDLTLVQSISTSLIMFSTVGYVADRAINESINILFGIEGLLGAVFIALLASAVYRKITR